MRIGQGWDVHRLVAGRPLLLAGVRVPFRRGLLGHSDGDAVLHAVTDAILGALAEGDIGQQFPDTDPTYRGIDSAILLGTVVDRATARGWQVENVDVTVLAERPKLARHLPSMRARLAALLAIDAGRVGIKAKTMEGLGAIGAGEAIAAQAVVLLAPAARRGTGRPGRASARARRPPRSARGGPRSGSSARPTRR